MNFKEQVAHPPSVEGEYEANSQDYDIENVGDSASDKVSEKGLFDEMWFFHIVFWRVFLVSFSSKSDLTHYFLWTGFVDI